MKHLKKISITIIVLAIVCLYSFSVNAVAVGYNFNLNNAYDANYSAQYQSHVVQYANGFATVSSDGMGCAIAKNESGIVDGGCEESLVNFHFYPNAGYYAVMNIDGANMPISNNFYAYKFNEKARKSINISFIKIEEPQVNNQPEQKQPEQINQNSNTKKEETTKEEKKDESTKEEDKKSESNKLENNNVEFISKDKINSDYKLEVKDITADEKNNKLLDKYNVKVVYDINILNNNNDIVKIENGEYVIRIQSEEELNKNHTVLYISNDNVEEMETKISGKIIEFKTSHLSKYAIVEKIQTNDSKKVTVENNKKNNMPLIISIVVLVIIIAVTTILILKKKKIKND